MRNGLSYSESGRLGAIKSNEIAKIKKEEKISKYFLNPNKCKQCGVSIQYEKRTNKFCSQSCSASYCNRIRIRKSETQEIIIKDANNNIVKNKCLNCGLELNSYKSKYCSVDCHIKHKWKKRKDFFEKNGFFENCNNETSMMRLVKKYVLEKRGNRCEICGMLEWMGKPIPLILDHIDGRHDNNKLENFRLVCGNCDMQLPTYKSKNKGNGRKDRRDRYKEGKTY